jgi:hypothetical protein
MAASGTKLECLAAQQFGPVSRGIGDMAGGSASCRPPLVRNAVIFYG